MGKTRLDPPTTNARSVYVERQNVNESGLVPGGRSAASPSTASSSAPAMAGNVQTVNYPDGLSDVPDSNPQTAKPEQDKKSPLRWQSVEAAPKKTENSIPVSAETPDPDGLTAEELANYRYVYDFSVIPPRKVPVDRPIPARGMTMEPVCAQNSEPSPVQASGQISAPTPQLVGQTFDPYAPNRKFERRRANLSRTLSAEFDSPETVPSSVQYAQKGNLPQTTTEPVQTAQNSKFKSSALNSGWRVVAAPEPVIDSFESVAEAQTAPVNQAIGTEVKVPEIKSNSKDDSALNLLDLPER